MSIPPPPANQNVPDGSLPVQAQTTFGGFALVRVGSNDVFLSRCAAVSAPGVDSARSQALRGGNKGINL